MGERHGPWPCVTCGVPHEGMGQQGAPCESFGRGVRLGLTRGAAAERARIVAWLLREGHDDRDAANADRIEAGEHMPEQGGEE